MAAKPGESPNLRVNPQKRRGRNLKKLYEEEWISEIPLSLVILERALGSGFSDVAGRSLKELYEEMWISEDPL